MRIKKKTHLHDAIRQVAKTATTPTGTFYFFPVWFQEAGEYDLKIVKQSELPEEVKAMIGEIINDKKEVNA